ncbi:ketohexokinase [Sporothrix brasiliensis 5110]|uniref:Ketohexokinase n=1 Tax=Sporothrix brasiliensis 5110 TaxID=1398154 RepID=A0A0C2FIF1_9PEZI|nr:ketohexokinase [Sporothrix brasiliensis 5110]KIH90848.1 ketohexokinase [Sporothrix brasiliensis 5110]
MKHLILTGACYVDTILSIPRFPGEDDKLRATACQIRRGGNCPNSIEVLLQLLQPPKSANVPGADQDAEVATYLVASLPARDAPATAMIARSFRPAAAGVDGDARRPNLDLCLYRDGHMAPASSYVLRSAATGSRTIVNHSDLPDMTADEFLAVAVRFFDSQTSPAAATRHTSSTVCSWWHFEGRIPETTSACIEHLLSRRDASNDIVISVEVEKPDRKGLRDLAAMADVVFYSKSWAEDQGYDSAEACLCGEAASLPQASLLLCTWGAQGASALAPGSGDHVVSCPASPVPTSKVVDAVGAGDTFVAGILYKLVSLSVQGESPHLDVSDDTARAALAFAVDLATRKIQIDGFQGLV